MSQLLSQTLRRPDQYQDQRPPADLSQLHRFTNGDNALACEVLELFLLGTPVHYECLKQACSGEVHCAPSNWHLAIHTIKSSAVTIGAWDVADIAVSLLEMPLDPRTHEHCQKVRHLGVVLDQVYEHIHGLILSLKSTRALA